MTSYERHGVSNRQLDFVFDRLFKLTAKEISKLHITGPFKGEFTDDRWIPLIKEHQCFFHAMTSSKEGTFSGGVIHELPVVLS